MKISSFQNPSLYIRKESLSLYICDLCNSIKEIEPVLVVDISILERPIELENTPKTALAERLASGQTIFVAFHQTKPVGYLFTATDRCCVGEVEDSFAVAPKEVYLFDAYTFKAFRGKHIYPALITHAARYYKNRSYTKALIFTSTTNVSSVKGIEKAGFCCYKNIHFHNFLGWKSWNHDRKNSDVQSRFSHEI